MPSLGLAFVATCLFVTTVECLAAEAKKGFLALNHDQEVKLWNTFQESERQLQQTEKQLRGGKGGPPPPPPPGEMGGLPPPPPSRPPPQPKQAPVRPTAQPKSKSSQDGYSGRVLNVDEILAAAAKGPPANSSAIPVPKVPVERAIPNRPEIVLDPPPWASEPQLDAMLGDSAMVINGGSVFVNPVLVNYTRDIIDNDSGKITNAIWQRVVDKASDKVAKQPAGQYLAKGEEPDNQEHRPSWANKPTNYAVKVQPDSEKTPCGRKIRECKLEYTCCGKVFERKQQEVINKTIQLNRNANDHPLLNTLAVRTDVHRKKMLLGEDQPSAGSTNSSIKSEAKPWINQQIDQKPAALKGRWRTSSTKKQDHGFNQPTLPLGLSFPADEYGAARASIGGVDWKARLNTAKAIFDRAKSAKPSSDGANVPGFGSYVPAIPNLESGMNQNCTHSQATELDDCNSMILACMNNVQRLHNTIKILAEEIRGRQEQSDLY